MIRDENGKFLDTSPFREAAIHFMENGTYCSEPWGSDRWYDYWYEQRRRCIEGYEVDGVKITGYHYFYLNFCPIQKVEDATSKKSVKVKGFPDFWDGDYNYFWSREIARNGMSEEEQKKLKLFVKIRPENLDGGYNFIVAKSRRKGYSYKSASIAACNFFTRPNSLTILAAEDKKYLYPKGLFSMAYDYISFINTNTAWAAPSDVINKPAQGHIKSSYIEYRNGIKVESGFKSEILAITFGDNPDAARGKDAYDFFFEESGAFGTPGLLKDSYFASMDCVKAGSIKTGMITLFGCVCKGTKVWLPTGKQANIEDITQDSGIVGYASRGVISENIPYIQEPSKKECVRITTKNGVIECSKDHPLLTKLYKSNYKATFKRAEDLSVGDYLLKSKQMPIFGNKRMWNPRLVGLLIGDGYYGSYYTSSQLCISEKEILDYIDSIGISYREHKGKQSDTPYFRYITLHHTQEELRLLGLQGQAGYNKRLPLNIWDYTKNDVAELLGGLFDSDGYVKEQKDKRLRITLTSTVLPLLEEVQIQLYKLGIKSTIYKRTPRKDTVLKSNVTGKSSIIKAKVSYSLEIKDKFSLRNFKKHIKLTVKKKQSRLDAYDLSYSPNEAHTTYEYVHTIEKGDFFIDNPTLEYLEKDKIVSIEDIGMQPIYNLSTEVSHTYITNGFISHNTSGDMDGGTADYADMFERPEAFELMPFINIWDDNSENQVCGFFHAVNVNMEGYYDKEGNSDLQRAKDDELEARERLKDKGATSVEMQKRLQEKPLSPSEAFASASINNFPVVELKRQLSKVKALPKEVLKGIPVDLIYDGDSVIAKPILKGAMPITSLYTLPSDLRGNVVVYEQPVNNAPRGLYKIGYDPVRQDKGSSLASIVVYKGVHTLTDRKNIIVAEYIGRLESAEDIDRIAEKLAILYNTTIMYENEVASVKNYFRRIKRLDLLAAQPDKVISANIKQSKVARVYGCHMNDRLKDAGERYIKDWLLEIVDYDEHNHPIRNLDNIYSVRLLEELIAYNRKGNFDMVSSLIMCMVQVQEEALDTSYGEKKEHNTAKKLLEMLK